MIITARLISSVNNVPTICPTLSKERALELLDKLGAHRFLFGTDFPMWTPKTELERFLELDLDETVRDRILFGNFESLFLK